MSLTSGTKPGPYEILSPIGVGGMGEVYKVSDTRLDHVVAVKVLPEHLAESPERRERFEREAKAMAALNHPQHLHTLRCRSARGKTLHCVVKTWRAKGLIHARRCNDRGQWLFDPRENDPPTPRSARKKLHQHPERHSHSKPAAGGAV